MKPPSFTDILLFCLLVVVVIACVIVGLCL